MVWPRKPHILTYNVQCKICMLFIPFSHFRCECNAKSRWRQLQIRGPNKKMLESDTKRSKALKVRTSNSPSCLIEKYILLPSLGTEVNYVTSCKLIILKEVVKREISKKIFLVLKYIFLNLGEGGQDLALPPSNLASPLLKVNYEVINDTGWRQSGGNKQNNCQILRIIIANNEHLCLLNDIKHCIKGICRI